MLRTLPVCAVLLALTLPCRAEPLTAAEPITRMKVQPTAAPKPALRYQLLPELREMNPGNPIQGYMKCFAEQYNFFHSKQATENRDKWLDAPLKELPLKELQDYGGSALRLADWAARLDTPDWQILLELKAEGYRLLLPDLQQLRDLAKALKVRCRAELAQGRFDEAIRTIKTMLALGRHLGQHPTLIGNLVGLAVVRLAMDTLEEMVQQPGCPNLYWALTDLPSPILSVRMGVRGERLFLLTEVASLNEKAPMSSAQIEEVIGRFQQMMRWGADADSPKRDVKKWLTSRAEDKTYLRAARARLVESGLDARAVEKFPPLQVILLDEKLTHDVLRDQQLKAMALPYWQAAQVFARDQPTKEAMEASLLSGFIGSCDVALKAQVRADQRVALLRAVEALRLHAAANRGQLPARLADLSVPVPLDPVTGKPFSYQREGNKATLRGTLPKGLDPKHYTKGHYEVTLY
jgi:tetratricopeptide (TPR) repeat protein